MAPNHQRGRRVFTPPIGGEPSGTDLSVEAKDTLDRALPGEHESLTARFRRMAEKLIQFYRPNQE